MKKIRLLSLIFAAASLAASAQASYEEICQSPEKVAGLYYVYPVTKSANTPAPKGYKPFYISHYGRHGSRYLIGEEQYTVPNRIFESADKAGMLTAKGQDVKRRLDEICRDAEGRAGELTPKGARQHHDIAQRMYRAFREVFNDKSAITAKSTTRMRCAHSMAAFCEGLKELNPKLNIPRESGQRYMKYLSQSNERAREFNRKDSPASMRSAKFERTEVKPQRLMSELFKDTAYLHESGIDATNLMCNLFRIAIDVPNTECEARLDDLFTPDERFILWQNYNYHYYNEMSNPPSAHGAVLDNARPLLANIVECADAAIARGGTGADLRFGHDSTVMPLVGLIKLDGCYGESDDPYTLHEVFADFKIIPMAANVQLIFFRNKANDVLVKIMLNEREMALPLETDNAPFYKWNTVRDYFTTL